MIEVYFIGGPWDLSKRIFPSLPRSRRIEFLERMDSPLDYEPKNKVRTVPTVTEGYIIVDHIATNQGSEADVFVAIYDHPQYRL